jgi:hypothetical protein
VERQGLQAKQSYFFFWAITPCITLKFNRRLGGVSSIFKVEEAKQETSMKQAESRTFYLLDAGFFLGLLKPEDRDDMFLRNVG